MQFLLLTLSPGKAISGLDVMVIFARACAALILPISVLSDASGIKACVRKENRNHANLFISVFRLHQLYLLGCSTFPPPCATTVPLSSCCPTKAKKTLP